MNPASVINEYTSVIKREKGKVKVLESTRAKLEHWTKGPMLLFKLFVALFNLLSKYK